MKALVIIGLLALTGCGGLRMDTSHTSTAQSSRVQYIVLHYTSADLQRSLELLTRGEVSAHYLIGDRPPTLYRLVDENRRAWHAGDSEWQGRTWLNASTLGIELVNPGYEEDAEGNRRWHPYPSEQIEVLIRLLKELMRRHELPPGSIIGHSDIAPQRKLDPGPLFPWQQLAEAGVAIWPDPARVAHYQQLLASQTPPLAWFEMALGRFGYSLARQPGQTDAARNVIAAFQMRFRPARYDGQPDAETAAILAALVPGSFAEIGRFTHLAEPVNDLP